MILMRMGNNYRIDWFFGVDALIESLYQRQNFGRNQIRSGLYPDIKAIEFFLLVVRVDKRHTEIEDNTCSLTR